MSTRQIEVQIMGQSYLLGCPDGGEVHLRAAVEKVDATMTRIRDGGKVRARDRIAVLAALNLAFDLVDRTKHSSATGSTEEHLSGAASPVSVARSAGDAESWHDLIQRLDSALGEDGRLL